MTQNYQTARDVIEEAKAFHQKLVGFYQHICGQAEKERVKLLCDYLRRHELQLIEKLGDYEEDASKEILDTWFQFTQEECDLSPFLQAEITPDMEVEDVVRLVMDLDRCLLDSYRIVLSNQIPDNVRSVFESLLDMEEQEKHKLARLALSADDM